MHPKTNDILESARNHPKQNKGTEQHHESGASEVTKSHWRMVGLGKESHHSVSGIGKHG